MFVRVLFLLSMLIGLAVAPIQAAGGCVKVERAARCERCCVPAEVTCCDSSQAPANPNPENANPPDGAAKQFVAPVRMLLGILPAPAVESIAVRRQIAAQIPVLPCIDQTCIRLI